MGRRCAALASVAAPRASKPPKRESSPTHASNRSPRMKIASARLSCRKSDHSANALGVLSVRCRSLMKSIARQSRGATTVADPIGSAATSRRMPASGQDGGALDRHVLERHIAVAGLAAGLYVLDRVDDFGAFDHPAEDRIAPALRGLSLIHI